MLFSETQRNLAKSFSVGFGIADTTDKIPCPIEIQGSGVYRPLVSLWETACQRNHRLLTRHARVPSSNAELVEKRPPCTGSSAAHDDVLQIERDRCTLPCNGWNDVAGEREWGLSRTTAAQSTTSSQRRTKELRAERHLVHITPRRCQSPGAPRGRPLQRRTTHDRTKWAGIPVLENDARGRDDEWPSIAHDRAFRAIGMTPGSRASNARCGDLSARTNCRRHRQERPPARDRWTRYDRLRSLASLRANPIQMVA